MDGTIAALSEILGPPDYISPPSLGGSDSCVDAEQVTWSGFTVVFAPSPSSGALQFAGWQNHSFIAFPDLPIQTRDGRKVGIPWAQTSPQPTVTNDEYLGIYLEWPDGVWAVGDTDGTISLMRGGDETCLGALYD